MAVDTSIHSRLEAIFRTVFDEPELELTRETSPATVPAWDSLSLIVLVTAVEREFGVRFSGDDLTTLETAGMLEDFLAAKTQRA
jgi:acyl carrier protein